MINSTFTLEIYTDGACHPPSQTGAWAAILLASAHQEEFVLQGLVKGSTHQRMEITAVIEALAYVHDKILPVPKVVVYTDSQYVADLPMRRLKLEQQEFMTKKGKEVQNTDLLQVFFAWLDKLEVIICKVKAHQKADVLPNHNRRVDQWVRKLLRKAIRSN